MLEPNADARRDDHPAGRQAASIASMCGSAAGGLYLLSFDCAHAGHDLTQRIRRSKSSREDDPELARLLAATAASDLPAFDAELVVSIPPKPGHDDRFRNIRPDVARRLGAADGGPVLSQTRVITDYRPLAIAERRLASRGRFAANQVVRDRSVLVIDDVVTSGAQAADAIRALADAGASALRFVAIATAAAGPAAQRAGRASPSDRSRTDTIRATLDSRTIRQMAERTVLEVIAVEALPAGASGSRRAVVRWSDGEAGEALRWWDDEVLFCEGDHGNRRLMSQAD